MKQKLSILLALLLTLSLTACQSKPSSDEDKPKDNISASEQEKDDDVEEDDDVEDIEDEEDVADMEDEADTDDVEAEDDVDNKDVAVEDDRDDEDTTAVEEDDVDENDVADMDADDDTDDKDVAVDTDTQLTEEQTEFLENVVEMLDTSLADGAPEEQSYEVYIEGFTVHVACTMLEVISTEIDMDELQETIIPILDATESAYVYFIDVLVGAGIPDPAISVEFYTGDGEWIGGTMVDSTTEHATS